jgi:hypothetical protein
MKRLLLLAVALFGLVQPPMTHADDTMVFIAHQDWLSRIYLLNMDGSVQKYYEYSFYYFADVEVVDNALYVAEGFAPRAYKVDIATGDLDVVIDDWSLYVFYDLAFDGTYFYVNEWDLNRYDINGNWDGITSFDETVFGSAWDGEFYWTLNDSDQIRCWDISAWPTVSEVTSNAFAPPSPACRGLWFDGQYFWTAESKEGLGSIFQFDHAGQVIDEWTEPAFYGWAACVIRDTVASVRPQSPHEQATFHLDANCPNPFTSHTAIRFSLAHQMHVTLSVYNTRGQVVATLVSEELGRGKHEVDWAPGDLASGIYFCRLEGTGITRTRKMILAR